jgi:hypothetical protein
MSGVLNTNNVALGDDVGKLCPVCALLIRGFQAIHRQTDGIIVHQSCFDEAELLEEPDAEDFAFAERAEDDKQAGYDSSRGV